MYAKNLIHRHWTKGGSGVTNFSHKDGIIYEVAIKQYEEYRPSEKGRLHTSFQSFDGRDGICSLHDVVNGDLSEFWRVFDSIKI